MEQDLYAERLKNETLENQIRQMKIVSNVKSIISRRSLSSDENDYDCDEDEKSDDSFEKDNNSTPTKLYL